HSCLNASLLVGQGIDIMWSFQHHIHYIVINNQKVFPERDNTASRDDATLHIGFSGDKFNTDYRVALIILIDVDVSGFAQKASLLCKNPCPLNCDILLDQFYCCG